MYWLYLSPWARCHLYLIVFQDYKKYVQNTGLVLRFQYFPFCWHFSISAVDVNAFLILMWLHFTPTFPIAMQSARQQELGLHYTGSLMTVRSWWNLNSSTSPQFTLHRAFLSNAVGARQVCFIPKGSISQCQLNLIWNPRSHMRTTDK